MVSAGLPGAVVASLASSQVQRPLLHYVASSLPSGEALMTIRKDFKKNCLQQERSLSTGFRAYILFYAHQVLTGRSENKFGASFCLLEDVLCIQVCHKFLFGSSWTVKEIVEQRLARIIDQQLRSTLVENLEAYRVQGNNIQQAWIFYDYFKALYVKNLHNLRLWVTHIKTNTHRNFDFQNLRICWKVCDLSCLGQVAIESCLWNVDSHHVGNVGANRPSHHILCVVEANRYLVPF